MSAITKWAEKKREQVITGERAKFDFYPTDDDHIREAFDQLPGDLEVQHILDPGMGDGGYGWWARERFPDAKITGVDIRPEVGEPMWYNQVIIQDYLHYYGEGYFDLIIGNPPYVNAQAFVQHSMRILRPGGVINFLLRASFAESESRYEWFQRIPPRYIVTCSDRPSFREDGKSDPAHYAYFIWKKGWKGETVHRWSMANKEKAVNLTAQKPLFD